MNSDLLAEGLALGMGSTGVARHSLDAARRRLLQYGADSLGDVELLSLVSGINDDAVLQRLLGSGLKALLQQAPDHLAQQPGVGVGAAARVLASVTLARRLMIRPDERPRLKTPDSIFEFVRPHFLGLRREELHVLCFTARHQLLQHTCVSEGAADQCTVDPREVLAPAIASRAAGLVLVHNHPTGDPEPSTYDVALTRQLAEGAGLLSIKLLDHLVVTDRNYVSMLQRGLIEPTRMPAVTRLSAANDSLTAPDLR